MEVEERQVGTIMHYEELRELYIERGPKQSDTETSSDEDDVETELVTDSSHGEEANSIYETELDHTTPDNDEAPRDKSETGKTTSNLTDTTTN